MPDPDSRHRLGREHPRIDRLGRVFGRDDLLPIDPDLAPDDPSTPASTHRPATPVLHRRDPRILGSIALGGFAGTVARYGVARAFPARSAASRGRRSSSTHLVRFCSGCSSL